MTNDPITPILAALRARQAAHLAYERADLTCLAHGQPLPPGWAEKRVALWRDWRGAVGRHLRLTDGFMRRINDTKF